MYKKETVVLGRSRCPKCGHKLGFFELFPVFSYVCLWGKCKKCKESIEVEELLIEIISGLIFFGAFFYRWAWSADAESFSLVIIRDWILLGGLIFLFIYDFRYKIIPDKVSIPLIIILFVYNALLGYEIYKLLLAIFIGGGFFLAQYLISKGKWVGDGDIRMGALLGAGLGYPHIVLVLFLAYLMGGGYSVILLAMKKVKLKTQIAFGTFLAIGGGIALFFGDKIIDWYLNLL